MKSSVHRPAPLAPAQPLRQELARVARVGVLTGSVDDAFCATIAADGAVPRWLSASPGPESMPQAANPINKTMASRIRLVLTLGRVAHFGHDDPSTESFRRGTAQHPLSWPCPQQAAKQAPLLRLAAKAARALHRAAPETTADCAVPPLFHQSTNPEKVASKRNNIGRRGGPVAPRDGHAGHPPLN